jgi:TonB-linked SusC/RagA family outer membrane protein
MKKITSFFVCWVFIGFGVIFAQDIQISGKVTGADDGSSLPGVSVFVKGTSIGTATDVNGDYSLTVPPDATLVFSSVGMKTQEIQVAGQTVIDVSLETEAIEVGEVIVTALGLQRSEKVLGYTVSQIESEEITKTRSRSALNAIQGKVPGVEISSASNGAPGSSTRIFVRGVSTFREDNQPLYVVDGTPINNTWSGDNNLNGGIDFGNRGNDISPDDIETISILKGAAATALYGSRAANGVIMFTTKKGSYADKNKTNVTINSGLTVSSPLRLPQFQNDFGQGWDGIHLLRENGSWGPKFDGKERLWGHVVDNQQQLKPYVALEDNLADFFERGMAYNNSIAIDGGSDIYTYYLSYSNIYEDGIFPTDADKYNRNTFSLKGSAKITSKFTSSATINYVNKKASYVYTGQNSSTYNDLMQIPIDISIVDHKDYNNKFNNLDNYFTPWGIGNPYYGINENGNEYYEDRVYGNMEFNYRLLDWLSATWRIGTDVARANRKLWYAITQPEGYNAGSQSNEGEVSERSNIDRQTTSDLLLTFNKTFSDFTLTAVLGHTYNENYTKYMQTAVVGLDIPYFYEISNTSNNPTSEVETEHQRLIGVLGQFDINYKKFVNLQLSARNDWSSTLPIDNNSFQYYGANLSWIISDMIPDIQSVLYYGKLRVSAGQIGNDADPYQIKSVFVPGVIDGPWRDLLLPLGGVNGFEVSNLIGNPELKPEITNEIEFGADLLFLKGRIGIDITYYDRKTKDQIYTVPLPYSTGYRDQTLNIGEVQNKGIESSLLLVPVKTNSFVWDLSVNFSNNKNKVLKLRKGLDKIDLGGLNTIGYVAQVGEPIGQFEISVPMTDDEGHIVVDNQGLPVPASEKEIVGNSQYDYIIGINNQFSYKGLSLSFTLDIREGGLMYSRTADINYFTGNTPHTVFNDRQPFLVPNSVTIVGYEADGITPIYTENHYCVDMAHIDDYYQYGADELDEAFLLDKSFIKLREVALSYQLPASLFGKIPISGVTISLVGRNLLLWTPKDQNFIDPEVTTFGNDLESGFGEFSATPSVRSIGGNIKLVF